MLQGGAGLEPRATARDLLRLHAAFHDGARRADDVLELVGLAAAADTRVRRLSGGERQRLSLGLALVGDPEVLVLDEPTAGMDPEARRDTRDLIDTLRREGRTILLTTHDLGDVERLADRVAILHRGRIVADAPPEVLTAGDATAIAFTVHAPPTEAALERLAARLRRTTPPIGLRPAPADRADGRRRFEIEPGAASADLVLELAQWAAREGILVTELRSGAATLEERYLELTDDRDVEGAA